MGKIGGFKEYNRTDESNTIVKDVYQTIMSLRFRYLRKKKRARIEMYGLWNPILSQCPLGNLIDFNDMVHQEEWQGALRYNQQITFLNLQVAYALPL
jgi:glutamate synthase (NADPH/NADH) small chain